MDLSSIVISINNATQINSTSPNYKKPEILATKQTNIESDSINIKNKSIIPNFSLVEMFKADEKINSFKNELAKNNKVFILREDIQSYAQESINTPESFIKKLFPDAIITGTKNEHPFFNINFVSKGAEYKLSELTGGIVPSNGFTISKVKIFDDM
ncbi:MAG: hypothetical protein AABZ74_03725 [Cyanobacteriota bacterium]